MSKMALHLTEAKYQRMTGNKPPPRPPRPPRPAFRAAAEEPERFTFEVDLPPRACSSNEESSRHWRFRSKARKDYKEDIGWKIKEAGVPSFSCPVSITLVFYVGGKSSDGCYRPRDEQNAASAGKSIMDALVEMGIIRDDSKQFVRSYSATIVPRDQEPCRAGVVITIERLP